MACFGRRELLELTAKADKTNTIAIHTECQIAIRRYLDEAEHGEDRNGLLFRHCE